MKILLDDSDPDVAAELIEKFDNNVATPEMMLSAGGSIAPWFLSIFKL